MEKTITIQDKNGKVDTLNQNVIALNNGLIYVKPAGFNNFEMAMTIQSELMYFGYMLNQEALNALGKADKSVIVSFHDEIISYLKKMTGGVHSHRPFYPGFPEQVMELTEIELWMNQILHYIFKGAFGEVEWAGEKSTAFEHTTYTILKLADDAKFDSIFTDLCSVNQSLTPQDLETIKWFVNSGRELKFPEVIPFKENLCTLAAMGLDVPVKSTTDVLRIATHLSGGDISLPKVPPKTKKANAWSSKKVANPDRENFKFKKFSNSERRYILALLENSNCDVREMKLKLQRWIRLGEILHPGSYANKYPKVYKAFEKLRNEKVTSWYGAVNLAFNLSFKVGLDKLSERPGELFRRIDYLVRTSNEKELEQLLNTIEKVAPRVSNKVLFETYSHFENRRNPFKNRSVTIKGKRSKIKLPDLPAINANIIDSLQSTILNAIIAKFATLDPLGNCWIDPELKKIPVPTNMRSVNTSLKPVIRGQRVPIGNQNAKTIRAFVHWFDEKGHEDLDLTGIFIGMGKTKHIGWNGDKNTAYGVYSGDVRHRRGACAEYIDINVDNALRDGYNYVLIDVRNYEGRGLNTVKDTIAGFMEREHPEANPIWVPKTISNCQQLSSSSVNTLVCAIDLTTREYIMLDIDTNGIPVASANFEEIWEALKPYTMPPTLSVYNLLEWHVSSRGKLVDEDLAETKFTFEDFTNSYVEIMKYMGV